MAWIQQSTSFEYRHTAGDNFDCPRLSADWERVTGSKEGVSRIFEEITPSSTNRRRDHVILYSTPKLAQDSQIPELVENSANWEKLTKTVPGFTVPMVRVAELMHKTNWYITRKVNDELLKQGIGTVLYASEAISKMNDNFLTTSQRAAVKGALELAFQPFASDEMQLSTAMAQWYTCLCWMTLRNTVGHPLGLQLHKICGLTLADFKLDVEINAKYDSVRSAALVMVNLAEAMLADGSAT